MHEGGYRKHLGSHSGTRYSLILKGASNQACSATRSGLLEHATRHPFGASKAVATITGCPSQPRVADRPAAPGSHGNSKLAWTQAHGGNPKGCQAAKHASAARLGDTGASTQEVKLAPQKADGSMCDELLEQSRRIVGNARLCDAAAHHPVDAWRVWASKNVPEYTEESEEFPSRLRNFEKNAQVVREWWAKKSKQAGREQRGDLNGRADELPPDELRTGGLLHYPGDLTESSSYRKGWWRVREGL